MIFALGERWTHYWLAGWRQGDSQRQLIKFVTTLNHKPARVVILAGSTNKAPDALAWLQEIVAVIRDMLTDSERAAPDALEAAFQQATQRLPEHQKLRVDDAGLTLLVAIFQGGYLHLAHIGDNRAYLYRRGELYQLTTDHTKAEELVRAGRIMRIEMRTHPARFVSTRWLGDHKQPLVDRRIRDPYRQNKADTMSAPLPLRPGDRVLICSPEISNAVEDKTIKAALTGRANQAAIARLVTAVQQQTADLEAYAVGLWFYQPGVGQLIRQLIALLSKLLRRCLQLIGGVLGILLLVALVYILWQPMCRRTYDVSQLASKVLATQKCLTSLSLQPQSLTITGQIRQIEQTFCPSCRGWSQYILQGIESVSGVPVLVKQSGECLCEVPLLDSAMTTPPSSMTPTENQSQTGTAMDMPLPPFTRTSTLTASTPSQPVAVQLQSTPLPPNTSTATRTPLPPATATPIATATLTETATIISPVPITPSLPLTLVIELIAPPRDVVELRDNVTFVWQAEFPPPAGYAYQTIFWPLGKTPLNGFGIHDLVYEQDFAVLVPLATLDDRLKRDLLIPDRTYQWSVCLFNLRTQLLTDHCSSDQRTFIYKREQ